MTITPHILAGSAVAVALTTNPFVAFLLGVLIHFVLDAFPHVDPGTFFNPERDNNKPWPTWIYIYAASEFIIAWTIVILLFQTRSDFGIIVAGGFGGIAVDIIENNPYRVMRTWPFLKQIQWLHEKLHFDLNKKDWYWGILTQVIIIGGSLWYLLKY